METKWKRLIEAAKAYYVDSVPTGLSDSEYDALESQALREDNFSVRDYIFEKYFKGTKFLNSYIEKIKKTKVNGSMAVALRDTPARFSQDVYLNLKYDGSSLAIYLDPLTGRPQRVVTVGNANINDYGVDQTWKLLKFLPSQFPLGIAAIQAEALIDISRLPSGIDPERARQKANGLINSKDRGDEVDSLLTIRAYRYYPDLSTVLGQELAARDYAEVLREFQTTYSPVDGHIMFAPADVYRVGDISDFANNDRTTTSTGVFLNDGWVIYSKVGVCLGAYKFSGAGQGDIVTSRVQSIQWNNQISKGKDSWSANVIIDPVTIKGSTIKKPGAGSVGKLVKNTISPGAVVRIILANSTIPMVGDVVSPGDGNFMWPTCSCGYQMSEKDIFGSNLKCGNQECPERAQRMYQYLVENSTDIDLDKFFVIDRVKLSETGLNFAFLVQCVLGNDQKTFYETLCSYMKTDLSKRNVDLVWKSAWIAIKMYYEVH